ncbi:MAG: hypothetical protein Q9202_007059 [Teloschistes flavicans]
MSDNIDTEGAAVYPSAGKACGTCKMPDMSNMTWDDGVKWFYSTNFATPRMWPLGYILNDPYSPFHLERDSGSPTINWRDAFEDLLALQSGHSMVSEASRKAEDSFAARRRFENTSWFISQTNLALQSMHTISEFAKARQREKNDGAEIAAKMLDAVERDQEIVVAGVKDCQATFERLREKTASSQKPRGQWIASLMHSGAMPDWTWATWNSLQGPVMSFSRNDTSPELEASLSLSELELQQKFEDGRPWGFGTPEPLNVTPVLAMIEADNGPPWVAVPDHPFEEFKPSVSSVMFQAANTKSVKLPNGSMGTNVSILHTFVDGTSERKEYGQDAGKLLEEIENVRKSMEFVIEGILSMSYSETASRIQQLARDIKESDEGVSLDA